MSMYKSSADTEEKKCVAAMSAVVAGGEPE